MIFQLHVNWLNKLKTRTMVCFPLHLCDWRPQYTEGAVSPSWPAPLRLLCVMVYVHTGQKHSHLLHVLIVFQQSVKDQNPVRYLINTNYNFTKWSFSIIEVFYNNEYLIQLFKNTNKLSDLTFRVSNNYYIKQMSNAFKLKKSFTIW